MTRLAQLPGFDRTAHHEPVEGRAPRLRTRYYAFLSYSHDDKDLADWLHRELEKFRVPSGLAGKLTANGVVPRRLSPIFRDQHDLSAGDDLAVEIEAALAASQFLVVLCSPTAAKSRWTNLEVESFKRTRPEGCVLAAVAAGEPFASDLPGRDHEECFPPALRYKYDRRGHRTTKRAEPLAADFRDGGDGRRVAFLKLVAGMLGVGLDELVRREQTRRQRRLALLAAASLGGMAVTSTLAVTAIQARDAAREQRREAEGLIGFMLGDLKDKLEPIGRLDALDGVGSRVLAYYQREGTSDLTDAALSQRSRALSLMAEVAMSRGDTDGALRLYREAMAGTAESIARSPDDPDRLFEHAQNVFYVGEIAHNRGDFRTAENSMRDYKRLALQMVALRADSMKYRMEEQYADFNLGVVLWDQRKYPEAVSQFRRALATIEAISTADPQNRDYQQSVAESLAWLADAEHAVGNYPQAINARKRGIALLQRLFAADGDVNTQMRLIPAYRTLGMLYSEQGNGEAAIDQLRAAVNEAAALLPKEPTNAQWVQYALTAKLALARQLLLSKRKDEAAAQAAIACDTTNWWSKRHPESPKWQIALAACLTMRGRIALASGATQAALIPAQAALKVSKNAHTADRVSDAYQLAGAYRLVGDVEQRLGDTAAARVAWNSALALLPKGTTEMPSEMAEHAALLQRLGRGGEAEPLTARLSAIGYRLPV
jgi:tetratricopeptide (TPR) repeat protein